MIPELEFDQWRGRTQKPYRSVEIRGGAVYLHGCHIDAALRALKKLTQGEHLSSEIARHASYVKPSQRRRNKAALARSRKH